MYIPVRLKNYLLEGINIIVITYSNKLFYIHLYGNKINILLKSFILFSGTLQVTKDLDT